MPNLHYDVVIIGGGPAGLACAEKLGQSDKKVLLVEKNAKIGPKVCAGGIPQKAADWMALPPSLIKRKFDKVHYFSDWQQTQLSLSPAQQLLTIDREELGQFQWERVKKVGVDVLTAAKVTAIADNTIEIDDHESIRYDYLVGAGGAHSPTRHFLGLSMKDYNVAFQYWIDSPQLTKMEIHMLSQWFGCWYGWIFPHHQAASVGCGCNPFLFSVKELRKNFHLWLQKLGVAELAENLQAWIINYDYRGWQFGRVFLAGEAAGLTSALTGEGIFQAWVSGRAVAEQILGIHDSSRVFHQVIRQCQWHRQLIRLATRFPGLRKWAWEAFMLGVTIPGIRSMITQMIE